MDAINILNSKLDLLLKKHAASEADNKRLRAIIDGQNKVIQTLNKKITSLESNMVSVNLGSTNITDEEKQNMRTQLDVLIAEIDKILNTLND